MDNCGDKPPECLSGLQPLMAIMDQFRTGSVCLAIKLMLLHMVDAMGKILYLCQVQGTYSSGANRVPRESMSADGSRSWANKNG